jgi:hypothetical protein
MIFSSTRGLMFPSPLNSRNLLRGDGCSIEEAHSQQSTKERTEVFEKDYFRFVNANRKNLRLRDLICNRPAPAINLSGCATQLPRDNATLKTPTGRLLATAIAFRWRHPEDSKLGALFPSLSREMPASISIGGSRIQFPTGKIASRITKGGSLLC